MTNDGEEPLQPATGSETDGEASLSPATDLIDKTQRDDVRGEGPVRRDLDNRVRPPKAWGPIPGYILGRAGFITLGICAFLIIVFQDAGRRDWAIDFINDDLRAPVHDVAPFAAAGHFLDVLLDCDRKGQIDCHAHFPGYVLRIPLALGDTVGFVFSGGIVPALVIGLPTLLFYGFMAWGLYTDWQKGKMPVSWIINPFAYLWLLLVPAFMTWGFQLLLLLLLFIVKQTILACFVIAPMVLYAYHSWEQVEGWKKLTEWLDRIFGSTRSLPVPTKGD